MIHGGMFGLIRLVQSRGAETIIPQLLLDTADISLADIHQYYREIGKRVDENIEMSLRNFMTKRRHAGVQISI